MPQMILLGHRHVRRSARCVLASLLLGFLGFGYFASKCGDRGLE